MMAWLMILMSMVVLLHLSSTAADNNHEAVYSGEHFDAVTLSYKGRFIRATVLVLHSEECQDKFSELSVSRSRLPDSQYVLYTTYDPQAAPMHTWYQYRKKDQLEKRYRIRDCFAVLFFAAGSTPGNKPAIWDPTADPDFTKWVWSRVNVPVNIKNDLEVPVKVQFLGKGPQVDGVQLQPKEDKKVLVYTSYYLMITDLKSGSFKRGGVVSRPSMSFTATKDHQQLKDFKTSAEFLSSLGEKEKELSEKFDKFISEHAKRSLTNLKQPMIFPNFTEHGYEKRAMPEDLFTLINDFFMSTREYRRKEGLKNTGYINSEEKQCSMVYFELQQHVKEVIPAMIQPHLENWCDCQLELTQLYGVREYYNGHRLQNHVDRAEGHIISALMHIAKDLGGKQDWPLEVIDFSGARQEIFLEPGEMLLYESGKIIHGRPSTFQGRGYANAFIHFKPKGWSIVDNGTHIIDKDNEIEEFLFDPITDITTRKPLYLVPKEQHKDEL